MSDTITVTGLVVTDPRHIETGTGTHLTSFRILSTQRRFDRETRQWVDGEKTFFGVTAFRRLADHVAASVHKSDCVVVTGRLRVKPWESEGKHGLDVEVIADAIGHDLSWGTSVFTRPVSSSDASGAPSDDPSASGDAWSPAPEDEVAVPF